MNEWDGHQMLKYFINDNHRGGMRKRPSVGLVRSMLSTSVRKPLQPDPGQRQQNPTNL